MTADLPATTGRKSPEPAGRTLAELDQVRRQAVELLAALDRPPRALRIQAASVTVDITWPDRVGTALAAATAAVEPAGGEFLTAPIVGVFYHAAEPGAEPFVTVGSVIRPGQQVGIIEAMKLMIPVEADRAGRISAVLKGNAEPVEYGEPLFALDVDEVAG